MKRFASLCLVLALCLGAGVTTAQADEALSMLPAVNDYSQSGYTDVPAGCWFEPAARVCYETGLITGTTAGFEPEMTLSGGQLITIAARLREAIVGDSIPAVTPQPGQSPRWYDQYVSYLEKAGIAYPDPERPATRLQFAQLLWAVTPESYLPAVNTVSSLPDCDDAKVLALYKAGVLTGSDSYGTFNPAGTLRRHECAAMVARVVQPQLRQRFTLEKKPAASSGGATMSYEEEFRKTEALRVNGHSIPFSTLLDTMNPLIFRTDFGMAAEGERLDWDIQYSDVGDPASYFLNQALTQVIQDYLVASRAAALGCQPEDLPKVLTPDPAAALGRFYCAKHILVKDEATAVSVLAALMKNPSLETFDALMERYTTDPGLSRYPNGYLFTSGEMVTEFENAVKALDLYSCSSVPVKSQHGYHIILRLDPRDYPDWEKAVQSKLYESYLEDWMNSSTITPNNAELSKLDVRGWYEKYLAELGF